MDKQLTYITEQLKRFTNRMVNANINLNKIKNNFPATKSVYHKLSDNIDGDSLNELIMDYANFFSIHKIQLESSITKAKQEQLEIIFPLLAQMYAYYNELIHYADLMMIGKYQESCEKQLNFIQSKAFLNLLDKIPEKQANEIQNNNLILFMLSCLTYINLVDKNNKTINQAFFDIYKVFRQQYEHGKLDVRQYYFLRLIEAFYYFLLQQERMAYLSLGMLYHDFVENQTNMTLSQIKAKMTLQFIGMGEKPYMTLTLPNPFKQYLQYTLSNIKETKQQIIMEKRVMAQKNHS